MNKVITKVVALVIGAAILITDIWYSFDLMSSKSNTWWFGIVLIILGLWLFTLYVNWIFKPKNNKDESN